MSPIELYAPAAPIPPMLSPKPAAPDRERMVEVSEAVTWTDEPVTDAPPVT